MAETTAGAREAETGTSASERAMIEPVRLALYLAASILSLMTIAPLLYMLSMSLKDSSDVFGTNLIPNHATLANFVYVFTQVDFLRYLWNSFFVSAVVTVVALLFHSMAGYALARLRFPGRDAIFLAMFATFLISQPVIIVPLFILARTLHLLDSYAGLIIPSIFNAFGIFLLRQFYLAVPRELEEAALIDGAGYFRIWWSIIVPLSRPIFSALAILFFLANWNSFLWPLTIISNQDLWMVQVAIASFRQQYNGSWSYIMAASTVVALPTIVMFVIFQKRIIESIKTSGIK
jgi:multiple sugar transport system permease protein